MPTFTSQSTKRLSIILPTKDRAYPYLDNALSSFRDFIQPNHESFVGKTAVFLAELFRGHENIFEYNYRISDFVESFRSNGCLLKGNHGIGFNIFRLLVFEKC